ncbi:MAG TPA: hypothetical protein VFD05_04455 [Bacilli bacterium]|nr:hypothetical protein [Bacilli bacterium]
MTFSEFLEQYALLISALVAAVILVLIILFLVLPKLSKKTREVEVLTEDENAVIINALGGSENIIEISSQGSRVTVTLKDQTKFDEETLKKHGVSRTIIMEEKIILLVSETLATNLNKLR